MTTATLEFSIRREICQAGARLPSSARIFERINHLLANPDASSQGIVDIIKQDSAVALRVLRLANSVQFVRGEPFANLELAIDWIGLMHLYHLLAVTASANLFCEDLPHYRLTSDQVWRNAIATATAMQLIAEAGGADPRRAYTLGLFRPVGRIVLQRIALRRRLPVPAAQSPDPKNPHAWEQANLGLNHTEAVLTLFSEWGLHPSLGYGIQHHFDPASAPDSPDTAYAALLHVACWMSFEAGYGLSIEAGSWSTTPEILALARLPKFNLDPYVRRTKEITERLTAASAKN
jgi:HD-like signal output (HDOD) protein